MKNFLKYIKPKGRIKNSHYFSFTKEGWNEKLA
jgi:hypothetical protein